MNYYYWKEYYKKSGKSIPKIPYFPKTYVSPPETEWGNEQIRAGFTRFYDNGVYGDFTFGSWKLFGYEFRFYRDLEYICHFEFKYSPWSVKKGIHIETNDKKLLNVFIEKTNASENEIKEVIVLLENKINLNWKNVFDDNYIIENGFECFDNLYEKNMIKKKPISPKKKVNKKEHD